MAKIFRLHSGAKDTINHWGTSDKIGKKAIDSIPDSINATDRQEITSIPSPFARMDLVKQAFKVVADGSLDGNTAYHKLVSDALDVGQIFFNIEKYRSFIEIIVWDKNSCLNQLLQSADMEHRRLGQTYETYLQQDGAVYNFDSMDSIYLLNYKDPTGPKQMNIIGATSPATLFFTSANDLSFVGQKIKFGNDIPFDAQYKPLYQREFGYIKYWWSLKKGIANFERLFPEVDAYLEKTYSRLQVDQRGELNRDVVDGTYYRGNYDEIPIVPTAQQYVTVLREKIRRKPNVSVIHSGFEMEVSSELTVSGRVPLALPVDVYTEPTMYVEASWNKDTHVPYADARPIEARTLPDDGTQYPYVTIGDFLEDTIVKIPYYKFNSESFFDGNDEKSEQTDSFLLPLKKAFFDYFTTLDLRGKVNGKKRIELFRLQGGAVKVLLRIPIRSGDYVQYERIYYKDAKADAVHNKGAIIERDFTLGLYPGLIYPGTIEPYYRMALLDLDSVAGDDNAYSLHFYDKQNRPVQEEGVVYRNRTSGHTRFERYKMDSVTYILKKCFQYVCIKNENDPDICGVLIPKFVSKEGNHVFRFAIDFGTTNTHIEYRVDNASPQAFNIGKSDMQIQKTHVTEGLDFDEIFDSDFIPETIGKNCLYAYPMRTVLSESNNTDWGQSVWTMGHVNIPFTYEKRRSLPYNVLHTDLKWSTNEEDRKRASKYIESLLLLLRTKVLLNNGDLKRTEIVWFYPASMTQSRYNKFKDEWEKKFVELFGASKKNIISISESVAPYYYHKNRNGATSTAVSIDIGGGTTDVLMVDRGKPKNLTSFRFAANALFGDGYSFDSETNGLVKRYADKIMDLLEVNNLGALKDVLKSFLDKRISIDIIAFLFSLASNKEINEKNVEINFGDMLANDNRIKYVVILFYVAIMYHIAHIMKAEGFEMPRHITFSGNGSKVLNILSTNDETLVRLTKLIFEQIYEDDYPEDGLEIIRPADSKESTCKGGILQVPFQSQDYSEIKDMKTVLLGIDGQTFVEEHLTYKDISDTMRDKVVGTIQHFLDFAFGLDKKFSFYDNFDVDRSIMDKVRELCHKDIKTYLSNGVDCKKKAILQDGADDNVEETLFFYPLVGILNAVVRKIYQM